MNFFSLCFSLRGLYLDCLVAYLELLGSRNYRARQSIFLGLIRNLKALHLQLNWGHWGIFISLLLLSSQYIIIIARFFFDIKRVYGLQLLLLRWLYWPPKKFIFPNSHEDEFGFYFTFHTLMLAVSLTGWLVRPDRPVFMNTIAFPAIIGNFLY